MPPAALSRTRFRTGLAATAAAGLVLTACSGGVQTSTGGGGGDAPGRPARSRCMSVPPPAGPAT